LAESIHSPDFFCQILETSKFTKLSHYTVRTLIGYSEADWASDANDHKSTSGYLFMVNGTPVSWKSKKGMCCTLTAEAEYIALAYATQEVIC